MNRFCAAAVLLLLTAGCGSALEPEGAPVEDISVPSPYPEAAALPVGKITLPGGRILSVEIASKPKDLERGLMFRTSLAEDSGMLFVFPQPGMHQFWMKNTLIGLDMIFIDQRKKVAGVFHNVPASRPGDNEDDLARRTGFGQYVLELPAGAAQRYGLENGQQLVFDVPL